MSTTPASGAPPRIPGLAFYSIVTGFWIYATLTSIGHWQLLRQALPRWGVPSLEVQALELALLYPLLLLLCAAGRHVGYNIRDWRSIAVHAVFATVFGLCGRPALIAAHALTSQTSFLSNVQRFDGPNPQFFGRLYLSQALDEAFQYLMLQFILGGYSLYLRYRAEQSLRQTLALEYERARLQALRMRINPHFLYNTLSAIDGLVGRDPARAKLMVTGLGDLFRRTLADRDTEYISLREELELAEQYMNIQKVRFSDRLSYQLHTPPALLSIQVPPLLLQPLLENAVAHGMGASEGRVHVNVRCELDGDFVRVTVHNINEGQSTAPAPPGTGLGLESTRERLRAAFGASASLETDSPARGQFLVRLMFAPDKAITPAMVAVS